jgi:serine/threonine protein kinase
MFTLLNPVKTVQKPTGFYLSPRWKCNEVDMRQCQYLVMTFVSTDLDRLIGRNMLNLKPPVSKIHAPQASSQGGLYSFEVFVLSLGASLIKAVQGLHEAGFVHGDIRPCNVALEEPDYYRLVFLDVGATKWLEDFENTQVREAWVRKDIRQVPDFIRKLLERRYMSVYGAPMVDDLPGKLKNVGEGDYDSIQAFFLRELKSRFKVKPTYNHVLYHYIP